MNQMKNTIFVCILFLTGCGAANQSYVHNQYEQTANSEMIAWQEAQATSDKKCGKYSDKNPLPREKALKVYECYSEVSREIVGPVAINPQLMNAYLIELQELGLAYKKGQIDRDEGKIKMQKAWSNYIAKLDKQYQSSMAQAYQADIQASQQRQQALQNLNKQAQEMNNTSSMKTTNCNVFGNTMSCTEF